MQTFIILLHEAAPTAPDDLKAAGFEVYAFADNALLVRAKSAITKDVARAARLTSEGGVPGIVFKLDRTYAGYTEATLWEWLDMHRAEADA